jgi:hypothetical protein
VFASSKNLGPQVVTATLPPMRATRLSSLRAACISGTKKIPKTHTTASKLFSSKGSWVRSPDRTRYSLTRVASLWRVLVRAGSPQVNAHNCSVWTYDLRRWNRRSSTSTTDIEHARSGSQLKSFNSATPISLPESVRRMIVEVRGCVVGDDRFLFCVL